ncbi:GNAT family N-acetyltransferase [Chloroflexota bacterium]
MKLPFLSHFETMIIGEKIRLREKRLDDIRDDYAWQTDSELARLDAAPPLTTTFVRYLSDYTCNLCAPASIGYHFAIETIEGKHIGNCVVHNVDETKGEAELGIMIGNRDYWDKGCGADAVAILVNNIFRETGLRRIYLKALDWNKRARKCFKKCGFTPCGRLVQNGFVFILMEIHREQWEKRQTETERALPV